MPVIDVKQTPQQFKDLFTDWLNHYVNKAFKLGEVLSFVTYQPSVAEPSPLKVIEHTKKLFGGVVYVEVIEQTFESNKMRNDGGYLDCYHSHLIMRKEDYNLIKEELKGLDVVEKAVYDLHGLTYGYLIKQAGANHNRLLPIQNIPKPKHEPIETNEPINENIVERFQSKIIQVFPNVSNAFILLKGFKETNKIYWMQMFIDDT